MLKNAFYCALLDLQRDSVRAIIVIITIGVGISVSMTMVALLAILSGDPIPSKSSQLYIPRLDPRPGAINTEVGDLPYQLTYLDVVSLRNDGAAKRQAAMVGGSVSVFSQGPDYAQTSNARFTDAPFFDLFDVPFQFGHAWSTKDDRDEARVVVLSRTLNRHLYGDANSVGRSIIIDEQVFRIIGILDTWRPAPRFYDLSSGGFANPEHVYLPFNTAIGLELRTQGKVDCWDDRDNRRPETWPCTWVQLWVELESRAELERYERYLTEYAARQRKAGRFQSDTARATDLTSFLDERDVVPGDAKLQFWLAIGFLFFCLVNAKVVLLARFLERGREIAIRRSIGVTRSEIFSALLVEAAILGILGGGLGVIGLSAGIQIFRQQPAQYSNLVSLNVTLVALSVIGAILVAVLAAVWPASRACRVPPNTLVNS